MGRVAVFASEKSEGLIKIAKNDKREVQNKAM